MFTFRAPHFISSSATLLEELAARGVLDVSVSHEWMGSLFDPWGISPISRMHGRIADAFRVARAFVCTNGTTTANALGLWTLLDPGDTVVIERDCHRSLYFAALQAGADIVWFDPPYAADLGVTLGAVEKELRALLDANAGVTAVALTSPKYFGAVGELRSCVALCRGRGIRVLVDEAHGDCLPFHEELPTSATDPSVRADIVTWSIHKSTEAESQASILFIADPDLEYRFLRVLQTTTAISTSFSFRILASADRVVTRLARDGESGLSAALAVADALRSRVNAIPGLSSWPLDLVGRYPGLQEYNRLRVPVDASALGMTGLQLAEELRKPKDPRRRIVAELADLRYVLFLVSGANGPRQLDHLLDRLRGIAANPPMPAALGDDPIPLERPRRLVDPLSAWLADRKGPTADRAAGRVRVVAVDEAIGYPAGEAIGVYPPGSFIFVHGEEVRAEAVGYLRRIVALNGHLTGASDPTFTRMQIIEREGAPSCRR